jgi:hypothetical protein
MAIILKYPNFQGLPLSPKDNLLTKGSRKFFAGAFYWNNLLPLPAISGSSLPSAQWFWIAALYPRLCRRIDYYGSRSHTGLVLFLTKRFESKNYCSFPYRFGA